MARRSDLAEGKPVSLVGRWLRGTGSGRSTGVPVQLSCPCGRVLSTVRKRRHQVLACPGCGADVFVLPASPWPSAAPPGPAGSADLPDGAARGAAPHADARWWRMPLFAAVGTLVVVVGGFFVLLPRLASPPPAAPAGAAADPRAAAEAGRRALAEGNFFLAARELSAASLLPAGGRAAAEVRELEQLRRQADLLSRLHGRSLQEILGEALPLRRDDEWKARFREQHEGKAVVFDDVVVRDPAGRPALAVYRVRVGDERARVAVDDLRLLGRLPIDPPRRLLFGGRLADLVREDGGTWAFRFDPDSAVLLTDAGAVAACLGPPDADLLEVLRRQEQWLAEVAPRTDAP